MAKLKKKYKSLDAEVEVTPKELIEDNFQIVNEDTDLQLSDDVIIDETISDSIADTSGDLSGIQETFTVSGTDDDKQLVQTAIRKNLPLKPCWADKPGSMKFTVGQKVMIRNCKEDIPTIYKVISPAKEKDHIEVSVSGLQHPIIISQKKLKQAPDDAPFYSFWDLNDPYKKWKMNQELKKLKTNIETEKETSKKKRLIPKKR